MRVLICAILISLLFCHCKNDSYTPYEEKSDQLYELTKDLLPEEKWGYINKEGNEVIDIQYQDAGDFIEGMAPVKLNDRWGYINQTGKIVIPINFSAAWNFENGIAKVKDGKGKVGFIDTLGVYLIEPIFDDLGNYSDDLIWYRLGARYGYILPSGKKILDTIYSSVSDFSNGLAKVQDQNGYHLIDTNGKQLKNLQSSNFGKASEGLISFKKNKQYGFVNTKGREIIKPQYQYAYSFQNGKAIVVRDDKFGLIDKKGKNLIPHEFNQLWRVADSKLAGEREGVYGIFGDDFSFTELPNVNELNSYTESTLCYSEGEFYGFLDESGAVLCPPTFYLAWPFREGFARVATQYGFTYIDKDCNIPFKTPFHDIRDFSEGLARVMRY